MKNFNFYVLVAVSSLVSVPAFADPLGSILSLVFGQQPASPPCGAPAPLLAAGLPAFIALAGAALVMMLFRQRSLRNQ